MCIRDRINDIPCDIHGVPISGNTVIAKLYRISGSSKEAYTPERWPVSFLKEGVEVLSSHPDVYKRQMLKEL